MLTPYDHSDSVDDTILWHWVQAGSHCKDKEQIKVTRYRILWNATIKSLKGHSGVLYSFLFWCLKIIKLICSVKSLMFSQKHIWNFQPCHSVILKLRLKSLFFPNSWNTQRWTREIRKVLICFCQIGTECVFWRQNEFLWIKSGRLGWTFNVFFFLMKRSVFVLIISAMMPDRRTISQWQQQDISVTCYVSLTQQNISPAL